MRGGESGTEAQAAACRSAAAARQRVQTEEVTCRPETLVQGNVVAAPSLPPSPSLPPAVTALATTSLSKHAVASALVAAAASSLPVPPGGDLNAWYCPGAFDLASTEQHPTRVN